MLLQITAYSTVLFVNFIFLLVLSLFLIRRKNYKGALLLGYVMAAAAWWSLMGALEGSVYGSANKVLLSQLSYLGITLAGPMWLLFSIEFAQYDKNAFRWVKYLLTVFVIFACTVVFTNEYHHLLWTSTRAVSEGGFATVVYEHGPLFYVHMIGQYLCLASGVGLLAYYASKQMVETKRLVRNTLLSIIFPWIANIAYIYIPSFENGYDLTPIAFAATGLVLSYSFFRNKYFELLPAAREKVLDSITSGIVITNARGEVIETNVAAKKMMGDDSKKGTTIMGRGMFINTAEGFEVFIKKLNVWVEVMRTALLDDKKRAVGYIYYLHNITKQKNEREKIKKSEFLFSSIINFLPDPVFVIDEKGVVINWNKAMETMTGIKSEVMVGKGDYAYSVPFYGKKRPMLVDLVLKGISTSKYYKGQDIHREGETLSVYLEGKNQVVLCVAKPLYDNYGRKVGAIEIVRDVTAQKNAERELHERIETLDKLNDIMLRREKRLSELSSRLKNQSSQDE